MDILSRISKYILISILCWPFFWSLQSCTEAARTAVRNYPKDSLFVFNNVIHLDADGLGKEDRTLLTNNLPNYWSDSLNAGRYRRYGFFYKVANPPVFDSSNFTPTVHNMESFLGSMGYFHPSIRDSFYVDSSVTRRTVYYQKDTAAGVVTEKKHKIKDRQRRVTVILNIKPNKPTVIDSLSYDISDSAMQRIALTYKPAAVIKPGISKFSNANISDELDRLVSLYRNHGYLKLSKGNLVAEIDTADLSLLQMNLDPFSQMLKMSEAAKKKSENPTVKMSVQLRPPLDSTFAESFQEAKTPYRIGRQYFYPETGVTEIPDSILLHQNYFPDKFISRSGHVQILSKESKFSPRPILEHFYLRHDSLYNDQDFYKTVNQLGQIGAWQQVDYRYRLLPDSTVDLYYFLVPAVKQNITVDLEASRNTGDFLSAVNFGTSSNSLLGLALNLTYRNRNAWKRAIQATTSLSNGVELNLGKDNVTNKLLQTVQSSLSQTYVFPRFITPFRIRDKSPYGIKTILSLSGSYQDRREYFRLKSFNAGWGYEWRNGNKTWNYRPLNVEFYQLDTLRLLDSALYYNPYIRNAFNTGTIVSQQFSLTMTYPDKNNSNALNYLRLAVEESGTLLGRIPSLGKNIYQYLRFDAEYRKQINFRYTQLAFRAKGGIGYNYYGSGKYGGTLPFYKQFLAGGPNSMRAWSLRQLGLGSSLVNDTSSTFRDRYGDMQLEVNMEYRYPIFAVGSSMKVNGALFTDIGNIWNVRKDPERPGSEFNVNRLGKDIAIGVGTGIRLDFDYFLIRLDLGIKLKDPARLANGGWLDISKFTWRNNEFPKTNPLSGAAVNRNNYALQLGINLPF